MTRRTLLRLLLASAVAEAVDVERLLWVPKTLITVPTLPMHTITLEEISALLRDVYYPRVAALMDQPSGFAKYFEVAA